MFWDGEMPYLQVDLDGRKKYALVATGLGVHVAFVSHGLQELWAMCWQAKVDCVSILQLECLFGVAAGERIGLVLTEFGFLSSLQDGRFRVCGAVKYLGLSAVNSANGRRRTKTAKRDMNGRLLPSAPPALHQRSTSAPPANSLPLHPTPNTQHPTPKKNLKTLRAEKTPAVDRPGWKELIASLFAEFEAVKGYLPVPDGMEWAALAKLYDRAKGDRPEICARWGRGLRAKFKERVDTFSDLGRKWDALGAKKTVDDFDEYDSEKWQREINSAEAK